MLIDKGVLVTAADQPIQHMCRSDVRAVIEREGSADIPVRFPGRCYGEGRIQRPFSVEPRCCRAQCAQQGCHPTLRHETSQSRTPVLLSRHEWPRSFNEAEGG